MPALDLSQFTSPKVRAYVYRVIVALAPVAILYGLLSEAEVAVWLGAGSAILGVGVAAANTPRKP